MFKKSLILFIALTLVFALVGQTSAAKTKIIFMTHTHKPFNDLLDKTLGMYVEKHPDVSIEYSHVPHGDFDPKILAMFAAGSGPHMFWSYYPNMIRLAENGYLDETPADIIADLEADVFPVTIEQSKYKGKTYGYPCPFVVLPIINIDLFEKLGLDYPTSYPEWLELQEKATDPKQQQFGISLSTSGSGGWIQQHWSPLLWGYGEAYLTEDLKKAALNTPGAVASLEDYKKLAPIDIIPDAFVVGKLTTTFSGWYMRTYYEQNAPQLNISVLPAPKGTKTNEPIANCYYWTWVVNKNKPDNEKAIAWGYFRFIASEEVNPLFDDIGHGVARKDSLERYKDDPWMNTYLENLPYSQRLPATPDWPEIQREIDIQAERFLSGEITAEEALSLAAEGVDKILSR